MGNPDGDQQASLDEVEEVLLSGREWRGAGLACGMQSLPLLMEGERMISGSQAFWQLGQHLGLGSANTTNQGLVTQG